MNNQQQAVLRYLRRMRQRDPFALTSDDTLKQALGFEPSLGELCDLGFVLQLESGYRLTASGLIAAAVSSPMKHFTP